MIKTNGTCQNVITCRLCCRHMIWVYNVQQVHGTYALNFYWVTLLYNHHSNSLKCLVHTVLEYGCLVLNLHDVGRKITIHALPNIDKYRYPNFCIDMNIAALFYRYIDIVDNDDSSSIYSFWYSHMVQGFITLNTLFY